MKRLRHLAFATQRGEQIRAEEQQARPIYDALAKALHYWDILGLAKYDNLAYESTVVWLLQQLPEAHDCQSVESLIVQVFAEQQMSSDFSSEQSLKLKFLADDIANSWAKYLQRNEQPTFSQAHSRARMRRFLLP